MLDLILIASFAGAPAAEAPPASSTWAEGAEQPAEEKDSPFPDGKAPDAESKDAEGKDAKKELSDEERAALEAVDLGPSQTLPAGEGESDSKPAEAEAPAEAPMAPQPEPAGPGPAAAEAEAEASQPAPALQPVGRPKRDRPVRPDREIDWRLELAGAAGTTFLPHSSFGLFNQEDRRMRNAGAEFRFDRKLNAPVFLGAGVGYRYMGSEGVDVLGSRQSEIDFHELRAFMRVAYMPLEGLDLYVAGGVGPSFVDYSVFTEDDATGSSIELLAEGIGGVMLYLPKRWLPAKGASRFTVGLDLGVAYVFRSPIDIEPTIPLDDEPLDHDFPDLGQLKASSVTWRAGVFVRFM